MGKLSRQKLEEKNRNHSSSNEVEMTIVENSQDPNSSQFIALNGVIEESMLPAVELKYFYEISTRNSKGRPDNSETKNVSQFFQLMDAEFLNLQCILKVDEITGLSKAKLSQNLWYAFKALSDNERALIHKQLGFASDPYYLAYVDFTGRVDVIEPFFFVCQWPECHIPFYGPVY